MSVQGQSRHIGRRLTTSGLPLETDIVKEAREGRKCCGASRAKKSAPPRWWVRLANSFWCNRLVRGRLSRWRTANVAADVAAAIQRVSAMDISAWLRGLGLERYEQAFRDNAIDEAILPKLTAEDLRDLA